MNIYVVGLGPGSSKNITPQVSQVIRDCDTVVGYGTYIDLIRPLIEDKEIVENWNEKKERRCQKAVDLALEGKKVVVVLKWRPRSFMVWLVCFMKLQSF